MIGIEIPFSVNEIPVVFKAIAVTVVLFLFWSFLAYMEYRHGDEKDKN